MEHVICRELRSRFVHASSKLAMLGDALDAHRRTSRAMASRSLRMRSRRLLRMLMRTPAPRRRLAGVSSDFGFVIVVTERDFVVLWSSSGDDSAMATDARRLFEFDEHHFGRIELASTRGGKAFCKTRGRAPMPISDLLEVGECCPRAYRYRLCFGLAAHFHEFERAHVHAY